MLGFVHGREQRFLGHGREKRILACRGSELEVSREQEPAGFGRRSEERIRTSVL